MLGAAEVLDDAEVLEDAEGVGDVADAVTGIEDGLGLASVAAGRSAIVTVDEPAIAATARATTPAVAMIGKSATRLPSGRSSRQLGQKPETGVVT